MKLNAPPDKGRIVQLLECVIRVKLFCLPFAVEFGIAFFVQKDHGNADEDRKTEKNEDQGPGGGRTAVGVQVADGKHGDSGQNRLDDRQDPVDASPMAGGNALGNIGSAGNGHKDLTHGKQGNGGKVDGDNAQSQQEAGIADEDHTDADDNLFRFKDL